VGERRSPPGDRPPGPRVPEVPPASRDATPAPVPAAAVTVTLRLSPLERSRYEALLRRPERRARRKASRTEIVLRALEAAAGDDGRDDARGSASGRAPNEVVITLCPTCRAGAVAGDAGRSLDPVTVETLLCDARVVVRGNPARSTIPPSVRRRVLARDGYRCRASGCDHRHGLHVHHRVPRGPGDDPDNLITLCASCHEAVHAMARGRVGPTPTSTSMTATEPATEPSGPAGRADRASLASSMDPAGVREGSREPRARRGRPTCGHGASP